MAPPLELALLLLLHHSGQRPPPNAHGAEAALEAPEELQGLGQLELEHPLPWLHHELLPA